MTVESASQKWRVRIGYALSAAVILVLLRSAWLKLSGDPQVAQQVVEHFGYPASTVVGIGALELLCMLVYAVPRTATLGAVLLTGYLGGAIATEVRIGEPFVAPLGVAAVAWLGLYLRHEGVQELASRMARRRPQTATAASASRQAASTSRLTDEGSR